MNSCNGRLGVFLLFLFAVKDTARGDLLSLAGAAKNLRPVIVAGDPAGDPFDTPALRIDNNLSTSPFSGVGSVFADLPTPLGGFIGTGTPISPYHVLTAAHVIDSDNDGLSNFLPSEVSFILNYSGSASHTLGVSALTIHPDFDGFNNPAGVVNDDLVILTLSSPLPAGLPIYPLHTTAITNIVPLIFAGYGISGDGVTGYMGDASLTVKRGGGNLLTIVDVDDEGSGDFEVFAFDFDDPNTVIDYDGIPFTLGNNIETTFGDGDSGGPAFTLTDDNVLELVGVNTFTFEFNVMGAPVPPFFGSGGGGILIEPYLPWIASVTAIPEAVRCCRSESWQWIRGLCAGYDRGFNSVVQHEPEFARILEEPSAEHLRVSAARYTSQASSDSRLDSLN